VTSERGIVNRSGRPETGVMAKLALATPGSEKMSMPEANSNPPWVSIDELSTMPTSKFLNVNCFIAWGD
jgi:hypothetical protein